MEEFLREEMARYKVEVWDKQSPIEGRPAELLKQHPDYREDGLVLLCFYDGKLAYFQPYHPFRGGPIKEEDLTELIPQWIRVLAEPAARQRYEEYLAAQKAAEEEQRKRDLEEAIAYLLAGGGV